MSGASTPIPVPRPRTQRTDTQKKPVPLPRVLRPPSPEPETMSSNSPKPGLFNIIRDEITERVHEKKKAVLEASRQIGEDLSEKITDKMNEKRRAVIETAKNAHQTMRKSMVRRFGSLNRDGEHESPSEEPRSISEPENAEIFHGIHFESPMTLEKKQKRKHFEKIHEDIYSEPPNYPPPSIPPPPLPDESVYDEPPPSSTSGSSSSYGGTLNRSPLNYEEIVLVGKNLLNYAQNNASSDTESDKASSTEKPGSNRVVNRSESWSFYDSVNRNESENIYSNENNNEEKSPETSKETIVNGTFTLPYSKEELSKMNIQRLSEISSVSVTNSMYENHVLQPQNLRRSASSADEHPEKRVTESVIIEFDPLTNLQTTPTTNDLSFLESILQGDTYGSIVRNERHSWSQESEEDESDAGESFTPPPPPKRFDSLPQEIDKTPQSNWFLEPPPTNDVEEPGKDEPNPTFRDTTKSPDKLNWMKQRISGVFQKLVPETTRNISRLSFRNKDEPKLKAAEKSPISPQPFVTHQGSVIKVGRCGGVEDLFGDINPRWCYLGSGKLFCYTDNTLKVLKETINVENILSVQLISQNKIINVPNKNGVPAEEEEYHCFEVTALGRGLRGRHVFGTRNLTDRRIWMQKLIEIQTIIFPTNLLTDFDRAGWVYLREGASGEWKTTWLLLHKRELVYVQEGQPRQSLDLRKARCILLQDADAEAPKTDDSGPQLLVDCAVGRALYIRSSVARNTRSWRQSIRCAAHNNGASLDQQQLTQDNIPVIVDKCINFIYAHGSMSEGIYRRSGTGKIITDILTEFTHDAWAVQLTKDKCSEHDVACMLKRFMRDLPEPAFTAKLHPFFCKVPDIQSDDEKIKTYRQLLDDLPVISQQTIKKLMAHLYFIQSQSDKNQMNIINLATIWGPTLLHSKGNDGMNWSKKEIAVVADLISFRGSLWPISSKELERERTMLTVLERYHQSSQTSAAARADSGDFRVWVHLHSPNSGNCFHITLTPQRTAGDVCLELSSKIKIPPHQLQLEESVLSGQLTRPIHHTEKALDSVLRWSYWDPADCKDNCLVLRPNDLYRSLESHRPLAVSNELKYADEKTKTFKTYTFEFSQAKLIYYKDKNCSIKLNEWRIEDIIWYVGHEAKRDPHARWCLTFLLKGTPPKRTKTTPWFGHAIAGSDHTQQLKWIAALASGEYPTGLIPPPIHVDLIES